jgi:hypothetical protein
MKLLGVGSRVVSDCEQVLRSHRQLETRDREGCLVRTERREDRWVLLWNSEPGWIGDADEIASLFVVAVGYRRASDSLAFSAGEDLIQADGAVRS